MRIRVLLLFSLMACGGGTTVPDASDDGGADAARDGSLDSGAGDSGAGDSGAGDSGAGDSASTDADTDGSIDADGGSDSGTDAGSPADRVDALLARLRAASLADAEADGILHEVAWQEGWPLSDGTRWVFLTRWNDAPGGVSLVSDVNGWDTTRAPAEVLASGHHYLVVLRDADLDVPARGAKYKWYGAGDVYRAPPEATAYGYDSFGEFGWVAPPTDASWLERFPDLRSTHLEATRTLRARLPAGFTRGDPARVLILHDGQNVFDPGAFYGGWHVDDALAAPGYADVVALAVDNAPDRMDAYTQVADDPELGSFVGGRADDYLALLEGEALPFLRERYGLSAAPGATAMMGSSLGGLVSLYFALTHDGEVGCVMAMSSTLGWGAFAPSLSGADALVGRWPTLGHGRTAIYLDSGGGVTGACADPDGDGVFEDAAQQDNYCVTVQLRDALAGLGYRMDRDLFYAWDPGAPHNEASWRARVPGALAACDAAGWSAP